MLTPGDLVTVYFPFSDGSGSKKRPALVISNQKFISETGEVVLAAISTKPASNTFEIPIEEWQKAGLQRWSKLCAGKLMTVRTALAKRIGRLTPSDWARAKDAIVSVICDKSCN